MIHSNKATDSSAFIDLLLASFYRVLNTSQTRYSGYSNDYEEKEEEEWDAKCSFSQAKFESRDEFILPPNLFLGRLSSLVEYNFML